jgi:hypothetical protein
LDSKDNNLNDILSGKALAHDVEDPLFVTHNTWKNNKNNEDETSQGLLCDMI